MAKIGRPEPLQGTETVTVTLPASAVGYLRFLATNTILGSTPTAVASLILTNALVKMLESERDRPAIPRA